MSYKMSKKTKKPNSIQQSISSEWTSRWEFNKKVKLLGKIYSVWEVAELPTNIVLPKSWATLLTSHN